MSKPPAYLWFLPVEGDECPDKRWRVTYTDGVRVFPVEVCAPDEGTAKMRAGMKRAEEMKLDGRLHFGRAKPTWETSGILEL